MYVWKYGLHDMVFSAMCVYIKDLYLNNIKCRSFELSFTPSPHQKKQQKKTTTLYYGFHKKY